MYTYNKYITLAPRRFQRTNMIADKIITYMKDNHNNIYHIITIILAGDPQSHPINYRN